MKAPFYAASAKSNLSSSNLNGTSVFNSDHSYCSVKTTIKLKGVKLTFYFPSRQGSNAQKVRRHIFCKVSTWSFTKDSLYFFLNWLGLRQSLKSIRELYSLSRLSKVLFVCLWKKKILLIEIFTCFQTIMTLLPFQYRK